MSDRQINPGGIHWADPQQYVPTLADIRAAREYADRLADRRLEWLLSDAVKVVDESGKEIA